ncbi:hypothetical protein [Paenibacillus radicis (ex Gao et al. 2016)]|uniref:Uncharacterized protein n=1 Tax=Paenibacillus radicis (ex Gao et al. 2016) TaxID=1737354 RepID=A0A917HI81_9BACL|nr:hypothetical protein [Paenibacillus radicis (ex Gao et al. 2016)]GGG79365.1 hypothetical protein GCM10010918_40510 [Paenibacillus radicis (ex Gao et al. 2016)]
MTRKVLPGVLTAEGQPIRVTVGATGDNEARIIDPVGVLTDPRSDHTPESRAAMSEFIRKCKSGEIEMKPI